MDADAGVAHVLVASSGIARNVPLTHDVDETTTTTATSYDASGIVG